MSSIILLIVLAFALFALPIVVFTVGQKRNWNWKYKTFSLIPLTLALVVAYFLFRTPDRFFRDEYSAITKTEFPKSGKIQYSTVSSMAFNGDHTSAFMAEFKKEDLQSLLAIVKNLQFDKAFNTFPEELEYLESKFGVEIWSKRICEPIYQ